MQAFFFWDRYLGQVAVPATVACCRHPTTPFSSRRPTTARVCCLDRQRSARNSAKLLARAHLSATPSPPELPLATELGGRGRISSTSPTVAPQAHQRAKSTLPYEWKAMRQLIGGVVALSLGALTASAVPIGTHSMSLYEIAASIQNHGGSSLILGYAACVFGFRQFMRMYITGATQAL